MKNTSRIYPGKMKIPENYREIQEELNECPVCKAPAHLIFPFEYGYDRPAKICCSNCGAHVYEVNMKKAVSAWNDAYSELELEDSDEEYFFTHITHAHCIDGDTIYAIERT